MIEPTKTLVERLQSYTKDKFIRLDSVLLADILEAAAAISQAQNYAAEANEARVKAEQKLQARKLDFLMGGGATCAKCDFRYQDYKGHIIPCPVCALTQSQKEVAELREIGKFLLGEQPLMGFWFGERPAAAPQFWWRKHLRAALKSY